MSTFAAMILPPDAFWGVTDVSSQAYPTNLGTLRAPFGLQVPGYAVGLSQGVPAVSTPWNAVIDPNTPVLNSTRMLQTKVNLRSDLNLGQVRWSIACDNSYQLIVNGTLVNVGLGGAATFSSITGNNGQFPNGLLHYGVNDIDVLISGNDANVPGGFWGGGGDGDDYFCMFITTDSCFSYPFPQITSPSDNSSFCPAPGVITITAQVDESTGNAGSQVAACTGLSISTVGFYDGTNLLGVVTSGSGDIYTFDWVNPPTGPHTLVARATDSAGISTPSVPISVTVGSYPGQPSVTKWLYGLTSFPPYAFPVYGTEFYIPTSITFTGMVLEAGCNQNTIANYSFYIYRGGTLVQTLGGSPVDPQNPGFYYATWNTSPAPGVYSVIAVARDSGGIASAPSQPSQFVVKGFGATGSMSTARYWHKAALLANGSVLVAGGQGGAGSSAEIYDPVGGFWSPAGNLITSRIYHTATSLNNGFVLVAGGAASGGGALSSSELYNPSSRAWSAASSMTMARFSHTATLLPGGSVLVTGGNGSSGVLSSTEEFNSGTYWLASGNMITPRFGHTATLLQNGQVLVTGGSGPPGILSSAELFNGTSWSSAGSMSTPRYYHTATLLPNGKVLVTGGQNTTGNLNSAEIFDPFSGPAGAWSILNSSMSTARCDHTATLLSQGVVLVAGGFGSGGSPSSAAEIYDPISGLFASTASLGTARGLHTATLLPSGLILIAGGQNGGGTAFNSSEIHYP